MAISRREAITFTLGLGVAGVLTAAELFRRQWSRAPEAEWTATDLEAHRLAYLKAVRLHRIVDDRGVITSGVIVNLNPIQVLTAEPCQEGVVKVFTGDIFDNSGMGQEKYIQFAPNASWRVTAKPVCDGKLELLTVTERFEGGSLEPLRPNGGIGEPNVARPQLSLGVNKILIMGYGDVYPEYRYLGVDLSRRPAKLGVNLPPTAVGAGVFDVQTLGLVALITEVEPKLAQLTYVK